MVGNWSIDRWRYRMGFLALVKSITLEIQADQDKANYSCSSASTCTRADNMGWRYFFITSGVVVLLMSIIRLAVMRLKETPRYLLSQSRDEEAVAVIQWLARRYDRPCTFDIVALRACEELGQTHSRNAGLNLRGHMRSLFSTNKIGLSTGLNFLSWLMIGLAYPLYNVFLPEYLASRGANTGDGSAYTTYRDYTVASAVSISGSVIAGYLCQVPRVGRRGTMVRNRSLLSFCMRTLTYWDSLLAASSLPFSFSLIPVSDLLLRTWDSPVQSRPV